MNGRRVQRVQKVHRVQRGRCPAPAGLAVMAPKGETTHYILRVAGAPSKCVRCAPPAAAGCIERLCSLPLKGKVAAPPQFIAPFPRKGVAPKATEEQRQFFSKSFGVPQPYWAAPFRSGKQKEGPFMGRLRANFARLGNPMQDCHLRKEPALRNSLMCHQCCMTESKSPLPQEGGGAVRRRRIGTSVLCQNLCSSGLRPAPSRSSTKGRRA